MKKLFLSLATIALTSGSLAGLSVLPKMLQNMPAKQKQAKSNTEADDIAKKLQGKTIKLDPNYWLGKNINDYTVPLDNIVVKQGILTDDEVQFVHWSNLTINIAGWYWTVGFTVWVGGHASGTICLDADSGETTAQIAAKLQSKPIQLNYNYWNNKDLKTNLTDLRSIIVNEGILNKIEASEITGLSGGDGYYTVNYNWVGEDYYINYIVNDNNTVSGTPDNPGVQVLNDGEDAQQLANTISGKDVRLKLPNKDADKYADNPQVLADIRQQFIADQWYNADQVKYLYAPHKVLRGLIFPYNKVHFTFNKDGQTARTERCYINF